MIEKTKEGMKIIDKQRKKKNRKEKKVGNIKLKKVNRIGRQRTKIMKIDNNNISKKGRNRNKKSSREMRNGRQKEEKIPSHMNTEFERQSGNQYKHKRDVQMNISLLQLNKLVTLLHFKANISLTFACRKTRKQR